MATRKENGDQKPKCQLETIYGNLKPKMTIRQTKWQLENKMATRKQNGDQKTKW